MMLSCFCFCLFCFYYYCTSCSASASASASSSPGRLLCPSDPRNGACQGSHMATLFAPLSRLLSPAHYDRIRLMPTSNLHRIALHEPPSRCVALQFPRPVSIVRDTPSMRTRSTTSTSSTASHNLSPTRALKPARILCLSQRTAIHATRSPALPL